jgi:ParB/RepB/Spo0J family partition protein
MEKQTTTIVQMRPTKELQFAPWNVNVMGQAEFEALRNDMRANGPASIDPLLCGTIGDKLVVVNGNHRLKIAMELGWDQVPVIVDGGIKDEVEARRVSYIKNAERGQIDPFKEAAMFEWFVTVQKWTHEQVAKAFNVDRTTVTKRLSLKQLDESAIKAAADTRRQLTVSHLEPIATRPKEEQKIIVKEVLEESRYEPVTVKDVEEITEDVRMRLEKEKAFAEAIKNAKYPTCTTKDEKGKQCGKPPGQFAYQGKPWVKCSVVWNHVWNLNTGKTERQLRAEEVAKSRAERAEVKKHQPPPVPHVLKTTHTIEEFRAAIVNFIRKQVAEATDITGISYDGLELLQGKKAQVIQYNDDEDVLHFDSGDGTDDDYWFNVEAKTWKSEDLKDFKAEVDFSSCESEKDFERKSKAVVEFLENNLPRKRGRPPKKK